MPIEWSRRTFGIGIVALSMIVISCHRYWTYDGPDQKVGNWRIQVWLETPPQDSCDADFVLQQAISAKDYGANSVLRIDSLAIFDADSVIGNTPIFRWYYVDAPFLYAFVRISCPRPKKLVFRGHYSYREDGGATEQLTIDHDLRFREFVADPGI